MSDNKPLTLDEAFEMCMEVWEILSLIDDFESEGLDLSIKQDILTEILGYERCSCGCPFCQYVEDMYKGCSKCPILIYCDGDTCNETPYNAWEDDVLTGSHNRSIAGDFFDLLCTIYKKHYNCEYGEKV